jgi:hypothetical protein
MKKARVPERAGLSSSSGGAALQRLQLHSKFQPSAEIVYFDVVW